MATYKTIRVDYIFQRFETQIRFFTKRPTSTQNINIRADIRLNGPQLFKSSKVGGTRVMQPLNIFR